MEVPRIDGNDLLELKLVTAITAPFCRGEAADTAADDPSAHRLLCKSQDEPHPWLTRRGERRSIRREPAPTFEPNASTLR